MLAKGVELLVTADLHYGSNPGGNAAVEALAQHAVARGGDVLLLVGDLATSTEALMQVLALFDAFPGVRLAVPGNHDVWTTSEVPGASLVLHEQQLPELFHKQGFHPLHVEPKVLGDLTFVGSMGWYDYSFRDDIGIDLAHYRKKLYPGKPRVRWNDAIFANFGLSDEEVTELCVTRLQKQLASVTTKQVVAAVHHVVHRDLRPMPRERVPTHWRFLNAFLGADALGEVLLAHAGVQQVFCGHIHREKTISVGACSLTTVAAAATEKQLLVATPTQVTERLFFGE